VVARYNWIKFYPDDWNADIALASCSYRTQGVYARLIAVLHRSDPYGYLLSNGSEPSPSDISRATGIPSNTYRASLRELIEKGVLKRDEIGIYSARMVRDQRKREEAQEIGKRGGNPMLVNQGVNPKVKGGVNRGVNLEAETDIEQDNKMVVGYPLTPVFKAWEDYTQSVIPTLTADRLRRLTEWLETEMKEHGMDGYNPAHEIVAEEIQRLKNKKPPPANPISYLEGTVRNKLQEEISGLEKC